MAVRSEGLAANSKDAAREQCRAAPEPLNLRNVNPDVNLAALRPFVAGFLFPFGHARTHHGDVPQRNFVAGQIAGDRLRRAPGSTHRYKPPSRFYP